jgi:peptide/nickel transport system permease protein
LLTQYLSFLAGALHFQFGYSISQYESVNAVLRTHAGVTALLIAYAIVLALVVAIPVSVRVAAREGGPADHFVRGTGLILFAMPAFWLGLLLILLLAVELPLFPVLGYQGGVGGSLRTLTLPALTLGLWASPLFIRTLRSSLIATLGSGFVEAARARGFSSRRVLYRHALRPSSISLTTLVGITIGWLVSGTVVVENVFALPGLGQVLVTAVKARDFPLVEALTLIFGLVVVLINLGTDVVYAIIDPRVRVAGAG